MLKEPRNLGVYLCLNLKVADLAKGEEVPPFVIALVSVEVVHRQDFPWYAWRLTPDTPIPNTLASFPALLLAVVVIAVSEVSHCTIPLPFT
ncbi:MAG: hypothetical protein AAF191_15670 [Verrucomicrobiota bacterium]